MKDVLTVIMAGGRGTRLMPLTEDRSKPAVPFGGIYRLIDIPLEQLHQLTALQDSDLSPV